MYIFIDKHLINSECISDIKNLDNDEYEMYDKKTKKLLNRCIVMQSGTTIFCNEKDLHDFYTIKLEEKINNLTNKQQ